MEDVNVILKNYNIKDIKIEILNKGYASQKWKIYDEENNIYILKQINKQNLERLKFILNVQSELNKYSPKIISTKDDLLYCTSGNNIYYLYKYIDANSVDINNKTLNEIGEFLFILHEKMKKIEMKKNTFLNVEDNIHVLNEYLKYYIENNKKDYIDILKYKLSILEKLTITHINFNNLTEQIIHGDFYIDNILYNKEYKIIDFDQCCHFYREYEVLRAMFMLSLTEDLNKKIILSNMKQFIRGYCNTSSLISPIDAYNLYLYVQANSLSSIKPIQSEDEQRKKFAKKRFKILKFLYENKKDIISILGGDNNEKADTSFSTSV